MTKLKKSGTIDLRDQRQITVNDMEALKALANQEIE